MKSERVLAAGEEVAHVDIDGGEAGAVEGIGHLVLAVDALFAEDGDAGAGGVEEGGACQRLGRWQPGGGDALGEVEGDLDGEAGAVGVVEEGEFFGGAGGVVAERGDVEGGFGPDAMEGGAGVAVERVRAGAEDEVVAGDRVADYARGDAGLGEKGDDLVGVLRADLEDGAEFFAEKTAKRSVQGAGFEFDLQAGAAGEGHFEEGDEEAAVGAVVVGEEPAVAVELLDGGEEGFEDGGIGRVGRGVAGLVIDLGE